MTARAFDPMTFVARDVVTIVAPLGLRFRDVATERVIADGLDVRHVWARGTRTRTAVANRSGVWVLADLPGLREARDGRRRRGLLDGGPRARAELRDRRRGHIRALSAVAARRAGTVPRALPAGVRLAALGGV